MEIQELESKILRLNNKELLEYIRKEFQHYDQSEEGIKENINSLKQLDIDLMNYGLARMKVILEDDFLKKATVFFTIFLAVISTIISTVTTLTNDSGTDLFKLFPMIIMALVFGLITLLFDKYRKGRYAATFFKEYLEYLIEEKKNSTQNVEN